MPPAAMASRVFATIGSASSSPRRCCRRRNSSAGAGGNFGAPPKPPHSGSNCRRSARAASPSRLSVSGSVDGRTSLEDLIASTSCFAEDAAAERRSR